MNKFKIVILIFVSLFIVLPDSFAAISISPLKYELTVEQGKTATKKIKITNEGETPITLYSSSEDFISGDNTGQPKFIKPQDQKSTELSLANWVKIKEKNITLDVGETREIEFEITVPENGEPGGHYGAVFFSPGVIGTGKVAFTQRIGILLLIDVPGKIVIDGNLESFKIGSSVEQNFVEKDSFDTLPIVFNSDFKNNGNIHLKPKGKIELIDSEGNILRNVGKETLTSPTGTFVGEKMVDYIPINDVEGNVLPHSNRTFVSSWEGFGYSVMNPDGTKKVLFKSIEEYYKDKASENQAYLMFWEQIRSKVVTKEITANFSMFYKSKDINQKDFNETKKFNIKYTQQYIGLNVYVIGGVGALVLALLLFVIIVLPKQRKKKENELRQKLMEEMKANQKED